MVFQEFVDCLLDLILIFTILGHFTDYYREFILTMWVYVIDANFWFYLTPNDLVAHLRGLLVVHMPVKNLEFDCVFNIEVGEDDCDSVAS